MIYHFYLIENETRDVQLSCENQKIGINLII